MQRIFIIEVPSKEPTQKQDDGTDDLTVLRGTSCVQPTEHGEPTGKSDLKEDVQGVRVYGVLIR